MNRNTALVIAVALLCGIGIGYWAASPKDNLEPLGGEPDHHAMMGSPAGTPGGVCPVQGDSAPATMGMGAGMDMSAEPDMLALEAAEKAARENPRDVEILVEAARQNRRFGRGAEAKAFLEKALQLKADHPGALFEMAVLNMHEFNDTRGAVEFFEKYLRVDPNGPKAEMARRAVETLKSGQ